MSDHDGEEPAPAVPNVPSSRENVQFDDYKVFNDPIHGHIMVHPLLVKIIDTPQFQRLRHVKQLGSTYFVYPGGSHNRFEHCIGVSHLAEKLARMLKEKQQDLNITDKDVLCVAMAGLCHDLGHGPFSHVFDGAFLPQVQEGNDWKHEKGSCVMLDHLIKENELDGDLEIYDISETDVIFVKEMINGPLGEGTDENGNWPYLGRGEEKSFLYEIVSNDRNGVDVDKWDYFARDCHHLGIRNGFDHSRFMQFIKVLRFEGRLQICARDKEYMNLIEMFHARSVLHKRAYKHPVVGAIDLMISKAFIMADPHFKIIGRDNRELSISQCVDDPVAFTKLNDNVFDAILYSTNPDLKPASTILARIQRRELYRYIGPIRSSKLTVTEIESKIISLDESKSLTESDIVANKVKINFGMGEQNPIDKFGFYSKSKTTEPFHIPSDEVSEMLPAKFQDREIRVYCTDNTKVDVAECCLEMLKQELNH